MQRKTLITINPEFLFAFYVLQRNDEIGKLYYGESIRSFSVFKIVQPAPYFGRISKHKTDGATNKLQSGWREYTRNHETVMFASIYEERCLNKRKSENRFRVKRQSRPLHGCVSVFTYMAVSVRINHTKRRLRKWIEKNEKYKNLNEPYRIYAIHITINQQRLQLTVTVGKKGATWKQWLCLNSSSSLCRNLK